MEIKAAIFVILYSTSVSVVSSLQPQDVTQFFSGAASTITNQLTTQLSNLLAFTSQIPGGRCPRLQENDVKFLLYTRDNPKYSIALNPYNPVEIQAGKKVIFVMHGWFSNPTSFAFPALKDAYLKRYDCNVIMVDWSISAFQMYRVAVCYLEQIAKIMASSLCLLEQQQNIPVNTIHLVGHSLGAQMAASISQKTSIMCGQKVGRITAMDPAKPYYQDIPKNRRLDKDDATFVDVIHTNEGVLGYYGECGDVDFYVNCGKVQPGCPSINLIDLLDHPLPTVTCEHFRSVEFMAESINSENFKAMPCPKCPSVCMPDLTGSNEITMGETCPKNASGPYVVYTNSEAPYGMGSQRRSRRVSRY